MQSGHSQKLGDIRPRFGNIKAPPALRCRETAPLRAPHLLLTFFILFLLPVFLAAQSTRETEAKKDVQAAKQAQAQGDYARAADGYEAALRLMPGVPELYSDLGLAYYYQKKYEKAIVAFQQALRRKSDLLGSNLFLGMAYVRTGQFKESIAPLRKAIALNPKLQEAYINLSGSYHELGKDEEALEVLQRAQKVFPNDAEVLYSLGTLYYHLMFKTYGKMARVAPNSYRYDQVMGKSFEEREEYPAAIYEYQQAIKKNPSAPGLHYALGNVYWLTAQLTKANQQFEAELEISPEDYMATWKLGNIYLQERQFDKALPYLQKVIQEKPDLGQAYQDLGKLYMETNHPQRALSYLKKVVEMAPDEPDPRYLLAMLYRHMGNTAEAQAEMGMFEKLTKAANERRRPPAGLLRAASGDQTGAPHPAEAPSTR
jgi:tetratricopeptide (TPR) repeat protein